MAWGYWVRDVSLPSFVSNIYVNQHAIDALNVLAKTLVVEPSIVAVWTTHSHYSPP